MGMSAGQARLLSITTRISNNEFRAQTITNSKLRLAEKSSEASQEYIDALNSQKLMYGIYNDNGDRTYTNLTAATLLTFGDLRNQYSMVNSAGQIMMSGSDIKKYEESDNLTDFLYQYGIKKVENPKYSETLEDIFGENWAEIYNPETDYTGWYDEYLAGGNTLFDVEDVSELSAEEYNNLAAAFKNAHGFDFAAITNEDGTIEYPDGLYGSYAYSLNSLPDAYVQQPDLLDYAQSILSPRCWDSTNISGMRNGNFSLSDENVFHMEHVLAQYLFNKLGDTITVEINGKNETIKNNTTNWSMSYGGGEGEDPMNVRGILNKEQNKELKTELEKLYYDICMRVEKDNSNYGHPDWESGLRDGASISKSAGYEYKDNKEISEKYFELINDLLLVVATDLCAAKDGDDRLNDENVQEFLTNYGTKLGDYNKFITGFKTFQQTTPSTIAQFKKALDNIPPEEIPDTSDSKYQWYVNLWYRMGGIDETTKGNPKYKELDENLMNNAEWLEFALEQGVITLEQAQFAENGSKDYPNMGTYDWVSTIYTNSSDIVSQDDEVAIAIAEAKYQKTVTEIESKDKKFDQDLKKLETEHSALQAEYESFKGTVDKNIERSFKAFS